MEKATEQIKNLDIRGKGERPNRLKRGGLPKRFDHVIESDLQPKEISKVGNRGKEIRLESNFAKFTIKQTEKYIVYDTIWSVTFMALRKKIQMLAEISKANSLKGCFCFDGRRLFTSEPWCEEQTTFQVKDTSISIREVTQIMNGTEEYYQVVNVLLNNLQVIMGQEKIGKGYFLGSNTTKKDILVESGPTYFEMDNFRVLGGFAAKLQRGTGVQDKPSILISIERINRVVSDNSVYRAYDRRSIDKLIGRDVITKHNNKTYRISDIKEMSVNEDITIGDVKTTYKKYFHDRYNIELQYDQQPFVLTKTKRINRQVIDEKVTYNEEEMTLSIPGEICYLCGFSDEEMSNMDLQKGLAGVLKREPNQRLRDIPNFVQWIQNDKCKNMISDWGIKIDNKPLAIRGRELPPMEVMSGGRKINDKIGDDWKFGKTVFKINPEAKHLIDVVIVDRRTNMYDNFLSDVDNEIRNIGGRSKIGSVKGCQMNEITNQLSEIAQRARDDVKQIALVFVPDDRAYAIVKSFTLQRGLLTQCVTTRNGTNRNDKRRKTVSSKTVMQIYSKFGYDPWGITMKMKPTMIVGLDTFHNKGAKRSIQASVFSCNISFSQYLSYVSAPANRHEFHETLGNNFNDALGNFNTSFKLLPARIIIFRDGVGDSQLDFTKRFEVDKVKENIQAVYSKFNKELPQIVYVVVKKRISTKLFISGQNPNPGTIVDQDVVKPNFYEFFLVSQRTTKGTATPTNYNVLEDTKFTNKEGNIEQMSPNELQHITYGLTHLYFNWMGTIRVPVPVHYAHRLAELVGKVSRSNVPVLHESIKKSLFYL